MNPEKNVEEFRDIPGFPGYSVSSFGRVLSYRHRRQRELVQHLDTVGRFIVRLSRNGRGYTLRVHRLVLDAFVGPRPPGMVGCHRNDDASNNRLDNLYWGTPQENAADRRRNGMYRLAAPDPRLYRDWPTEQAVYVIRQLRGYGIPVAGLALRFGLPEGKVRKIIRESA